MIQARYIRHPLYFHRPAGTSRGVLTEKDCWFVVLTGDKGLPGIGEVSFIPGLSVEDPGELEIRLDHVCKLVSRGEMDPRQPLPSLPGVQFALETAIADMEGGGRRILYPSDFTSGLCGIPTNGLIWMGDRSFVMEQVKEKISGGYRVLKMKVGALDFSDELEILRWIRSEFRTADLEIRLDANGAWKPGEVPRRLGELSRFGIHSIEQPIAPGQIESMASICRDSPVPIALDEELTGVAGKSQPSEMLRQIRPHYIILKPGLLGGFSAAGEWIAAAREVDTGWWVTSALESNIGLNAIAQWTFTLGVEMPQGLGTGMLYRNNVPSPLHLEGARLWHREVQPWDLTSLDL